MERKNEILLRNNEKLKNEKNRIRKSSVKGADSKYSLLFRENPNASILSGGNLFKTFNSTTMDQNTSFMSNNRYNTGLSKNMKRMSEADIDFTNVNNLSKNSELDKSDLDNNTNNISSIKISKLIEKDKDSKLEEKQEEKQNS